MAKFVTNKRLWLTKDRARVVEDGDPDAAFLLASAGKEIDAETAKRYGLGGKADGKQVAGPPEDKALKSATNKGRR